MRNIKKILLGLFILASVTSCKSKIEKIYNKNTDITKVAESVAKVKSIDEIITIKDGETIVYEKDTNLVISGSTLNTNVVEKTYTTGGQFTTTTNQKTIENFDTNSLFNYNLNKDYCVANGHLYMDNSITMIVDKNHASEFFNTTSFESLYNITVNLLFNENNLTKMNISYVSLNSKNVTLSYTYNY